MDVDVAKEQWDSVTKYVIPALQKKLKLSSGQNSFLKQDIWENSCGQEKSKNMIHSDPFNSGGATIGPNGYVPEIWKKVVYAEMTFSGGTRLDLYPFKEKIYPCSNAI